MGTVQRNRWMLAFMAMGIIMTWAGKAFDEKGDLGEVVSKEEAIELATQIINLVGVGWDDIMGAPK